MATIARVMYDVVARDGASRTFRRIGDDATFAEGRVARFGRTFAVAGGVVAAAAVAVGVESVRMATTFQAQMTRIQTQAGGSARDVKVLTGAVLGLSSRRAQQSPQMLAQALYHLKSVGMDNVHAMTALRSASDLAAVGGANLEDTTNALAGAWRSGIKGAQSFGKTAATVNAIIGAGNMTMTDFVGSLTSGILPAARTFGVSLRSVGAAMALMTDEGIPAEVAATRLRMTLSLLGAPSAKAQAQLKAIGLSSTSLANAMRSPGGLVAAVGLLKTHLDNSGLSATKAAQLISNAFGGGRSSAAIMTLLNNYSVLERKQNQINNTIGRYGAAVAAQRKTAGAEFERLRAIIDTVGIRIGLALLPPVTSFVSWIVNRAIPAVGRFGSRVGQVFDQVIPIGTIKRDWQDVLQFLGLSKPRPVKLVTGDQLHLPKAAPLFAGDLLHPQPFHFNDANLFHPLPKSAGAGLASSIASVLHGPAVGNALGTALGDAFASVATHAAMITSKLVTALAGLDWTTIGKTVGSQALGFGIGLIAGFGNDLFSVTWWKKHWWDAILTVLTVSAVGKFAGPLERIFAKIPILRSFTPLLRGIEKLTGPMNKAIGKVVEAVGNGLIDGFTKTFPTAAKWLTREGGLLTTRLGVMGIQMFDRSLSAGRGILRGIESGTSGLVQVVLGVIRRIVSPFRGAAGWLVRPGMDVVRGLLTGIRRFMGGIGTWVKGNIVDPLVNAVKHFFGIKSPSTVMAGIGGHLIGGLLKGMVAGSAGLVHAVFGSFPGALAHLVDKSLVSIASLPGRALRALGGLGGKLGHLLGGLFGGGGGTPGGSGVARWGSTVLKVLGMLGLPSSYLGAWLRQIATESGGNPRAINLTDSNAAAGHPSMGVLQTIISTFNAYAGPFRGLGPFNGLADIYAGINYATHRYGRLGQLAVIGHGHGYWQGGPITEPIWGIGRSGRSYSFGEGGLQEWVSRGRPGGHGVNGGLTSGGPLVHVAQMVVQDATDADLVARKLAFRVYAAGLGS